MRVLHKFNDKLIRLQQLHRSVTFITDGNKQFDVEERDMIVDNLLGEIRELEGEVHTDLKWMIEESNATNDD